MLLRIAYFVIPLCLIGGMVAATELPVPKSKAAQERAEKRKQEKFERVLLSPLGKGRLE